MPCERVGALRERRLYKRAVEIPAAELAADIGEWIADDWRRTIDVETRLARTVGLAPDELLLDYPAKTEMRFRESWGPWGWLSVEHASITAS